MRRLVIVVVLAILGGYLGICALLYFFQDSLIFFPRRASMTELETDARSAGFEPWKTSDGQSIGWQSPTGDPADVLVICHGNGGYALHRNYFAYSAAAVNGALPPKIFLLEYPGYGARPGIPSEPAFTAAAIEAIDSLAPGPARRITLLGQSLGSGVVSAAVRARPDLIDALILVTPFDSLVNAAHQHYPWLPVSWLIRHRFDSVENLKAFPGPVAFIVAEADQTVPAVLGQTLYETYSGTKRLWLVRDAHHNDTERLLADWPEIWNWLQEHSM